MYSLPAIKKEAFNSWGVSDGGDNVRMKLFPEMINDICKRIPAYSNERGLLGWAAIENNVILFNVFSTTMQWSPNKGFSE